MPDVRLQNQAAANAIETEIATTRTAQLAILDKATAEKRDLSADENASYERLDSNLDGLLAKLAQNEQRLASRNRAASVMPPVRGGDGQSLTIEFPGAGNIDGLRWGREPRQICIEPGLRMADGASVHALASDAYLAAWGRYMASGGRQSLGMKVGQDNKGGYWAPIQFVNNLIKFLDNNVFMRQLATVLPPMPSAVNIGVPTWDTDPGDADWTAEVPASDISEDDAARVGSREFMPHLLTKLLTPSLKLVRTSAIPIIPFLTQRLGYLFAITEEKAFLTGDGAQQPLGVFVASANGVPTSRDTTASSTTTFNADDLINLLFGLKEQYQKNATGLFSRTAIKIARKLKDGNGQYLWLPGLGGTPGMILDRPYVMSEYVPSTFTTGLYVGMFADFKAGYWIADSLGMTVEDVSILKRLKNLAAILASKETDGAPVLAEAFSRLILA